MAPGKSSSDLMKVGLEGFAMLEEYLGHKKKQQPQPQPLVYKQHKYWHQPQKPTVQVITQVPAAAQAVRIDCYEAAKFYGGTVIADYPDNNKMKKSPIY
ncbi:hypothetical protein DCAR_0726731 [Daucus carota subsp. sativus]|uniref:Uncharacterized protein n=1 Tax=Daucus carota subsp. sativus TaxID=79200 RepID=A0A161Y219_DAUCS|nr:hypothetical protein DCAR_0726731 [Daucus carota subsp. sativus]